ncbi:hypothetical protein HYU20_00945 [Candidatus Woesearchaeota archaeon]|nr:hypothetical protein [Candidatus Woesearchaeota archaeon]
MEKAVSKREAVADFLRGNTKKIAVAVAALALFSLLFGIPVKTTFVVLFLILAASFSTFYFNYFRAPVNFELVKLSTIIVAVTHGLLPGLAVGVASTFFGKVLIGRVDEKLPLSMLTISIIAVAAAIFNAADITTLGITLVFAYNVTMLALSIMMGGDLAWNIPYEGTNFLFNVFLFVKVAPLLLQLVQ